MHWRRKNSNSNGSGGSICSPNSWLSLFSSSSRWGLSQVDISGNIVCVRTYFLFCFIFQHWIHCSNQRQPKSAHLYFVLSQIDKQLRMFCIYIRWDPAYTEQKQGNFVRAVFPRFPGDFSNSMSSFCRQTFCKLHLKRISSYFKSVSFTPTWFLDFKGDS